MGFNVTNKTLCTKFTQSPAVTKLTAKIRWTIRNDLKYAKIFESVVILTKWEFTKFSGRNFYIRNNWWRLTEPERNYVYLIELGIT